MLQSRVYYHRKQRIGGHKLKWVVDTKEREDHLRHERERERRVLFLGILGNFGWFERSNFSNCWISISIINLFSFLLPVTRDHPCKSVVVLLAHIKTTVQVFHLISGVLVYSNSLEIDCLCVTLLECCDSGVEGPRFPALCM